MIPSSWLLFGCVLAGLSAGVLTPRCLAAADWPFFPFQNALTDSTHTAPAAQVQLAQAVGSEGYGIGGSAEANLRGTMDAWRELQRRLAAEPRAGTGPPRFTAAEDGGFRFDTGLLRGRLRADGRSLGLTEIEHKPTGTRLDGSYGWVGHYRVFTRGVRYGAGAWYWPSTATLQPDGAVRVLWPATEDRPFRMRADYRWLDAGTLEVDTAVEAVQPLRGFETFLASYFDAAFTNAQVRVLQSSQATTTWMRLEPSLGEWLMFPRDAAARELLEDGRWGLEPHPVAWVLPAEFAPPRATAMRRAPVSGLSVVLSAPGEDCFAIASPHELEGHFSTYFSLFGCDLSAGQSATARVRLSLVDPSQPTAVAPDPTAPRPDL